MPLGRPRGLLAQHQRLKLPAVQRLPVDQCLRHAVQDLPGLCEDNPGSGFRRVDQATAGIVLVRNDPWDVMRIVELSRATYANMVQNLAWAVGYNAITLPLAAGVLAIFGFVLPAWVEAVLMSVSTVVVALNSQTLRGLKLESW